MGAPNETVRRDHRADDWSKYDLLLVLLPIPLLLGALGGILSPLPYFVGLGLGALSSMVVLAYAVSVAAPVPATAEA